MTILSTRRNGHYHSALSLHPLFNVDFSHPLQKNLSHRTGDPLPALNIEEHDELIRIQVELPGVDKDSINVEYHHKVLSISGTKTITSDADNTSVHKEIQTGSFERTVRVGDVDFDAAKADYKDGILTLSLPIAEAQRPKRLVVK